MALRGLKFVAHRRQKAGLRQIGAFGPAARLVRIELGRVESAMSESFRATKTSRVAAAWRR